MNKFLRILIPLMISIIFSVGVSAYPTVQWLGDHSDIATATPSIDFYKRLVDEAKKVTKGFLGDVTLGEDISQLYGANAYGITTTKTTGSTTFVYTGDPNTDNSAAQNAIIQALGTSVNALTTEMCEVYLEFVADHPQYFWLSGNAEFSYSIQYSYDSTGNITYEVPIYFILAADSFDIRCPKYTDLSVIEADYKKQEQAIASILALPSVKNASTPAEKLHALNDALTSRNSYYSGVDITKAPHETHHGLAALVGASGGMGPVCEGYASAFKILCDYIDIPCVTINGYSVNNLGQGGTHMWNAVYLDDQWYAIDVTWDDPSSAADALGAVSGCECDDYFLVGEDTIINGVSFADTHIPDDHPLTGLGVQICDTSYGLTGGKDDPTPLSSLPFSDVDVTSKYADDIAFVYKEGLMNGVSASNFAPEAEVTRSMLVTILWRYGDSPAPTSIARFGDVPAGQWYSNAVTWAASHGIVTGVGDGTSFAPNDGVTLEQALIILARYAGQIGLSAGNTSPDLSAYQYSGWAASGVSFGAATGIIDEGKNLTAKATRAEIASFLHRFSNLDTK